MITLTNITLTRGTKILLEQSSVSIYAKQKVALIGRNGCGKSSLFSFLRGDIEASEGDFDIAKGIRVSHLSQHIEASKLSALDFVLSGDSDYFNLISRLHTAELNGDHDKMVKCHHELEEMQGYSKPSEAATILSGLGFEASEFDKPVSDFSGGWRVRLGLAQCLMRPSDLMLLDEPTNHLDMEAIYWLEKFLKNAPQTLIIISHDRDFLDAVCTHCIHIENQRLNLYTGNYSQFERIRAEKLALNQSMYEKQQKQIQHMMSFVERFKAKASKAKQAQSRLKQIDKIKLIAQTQVDSPFSFEFYPCTKLSQPLIALTKATMGYDKTKPILKEVNLNLNPGESIALLGPNGQGKSTLIKSLVGQLPIQDGERVASANLNVGYFAQHQIEQLDLSLSPIQTIQKIDTLASEQKIRAFLGGFDFMGDMATNTIQHFSGGEKARLVLASIVWQKPNVLLLDEPTNHLDLDMRQALEIALQSFEGALVLVSHDRHLIRMLSPEFLLVFQHTVREFNDDLDEYYRQISILMNQSSIATSPKTNDKTAKADKNRINKIEKLLQEKQKKYQEIQELLGTPEIYESHNQQKLNKATLEHQKLKHEIEILEEEWLSYLE
jgi:ATP-binding cassette subfamily F protein 3